MPLLPFFVLGMGLGLLTAWLEKYHVGAQGAAWSLTFGERCLIAGRALWFYAGKLVWPVQLTFIYPRWAIETEAVWQWLFPIAAVGVVAGLWLARRRIGKGPLVAVLFFAGTLGPALGFVDVYPMRFSFVADHFQYLAGVGLIVLCATGLNRVPRVIPAALIMVLGMLTWQQAGMYTDMTTLWRTTLARNPDCWMAHNNLGLLLKNQGRIEEAIEHYHQALQIDPNAWDALNDMGVALAARGQFDEAIEYYRKSLQINPDRFAVQKVQNNLGHALAAEGRFDEAIECYRQALQINPNYSDALNNLGIALTDKGRFDEAIENYRKAIQINPNFSEALNNLGVALAAKGQFDEAIKNYRQAVQINPNYSKAMDNLGGALAAKGRFDEAIENYRKAIQLNSNRPETFFHLGTTLDQLGRTREAIAQYREALRLNPNLTGALNNLAWVLATSPDDQLRDGAEAVRLAERARALTYYGEPLFIGTLATAYAECGRFPEAVTTAEKAEQLATAAGSKKLAEKNRQLLELYRAGKPYHESPPAASSSLQTPSHRTEQ
jgi:tetratricopeptide (TPR) repeat protein